MSKSRDLADLPAGSGDINIDGGTLFVDASENRITLGGATISSYQWTNWNPSDVSFTATNAPATGTSDDSPYITQSNSGGSLTITFNVGGKYFICITQQTFHGNAYTRDRQVVSLSGTATRRINRSPSNAGEADANFDLSISTGFYLSADAGQTLILLPNYQVDAPNAASFHTAECSVTTQYCGG